GEILVPLAAFFHLNSFDLGVVITGRKRIRLFGGRNVFAKFEDRYCFLVFTHVHLLLVERLVGSLCTTLFYDTQPLFISQSSFSFLGRKKPSSRPKRHAGCQSSEP